MKKLPPPQLPAKNPTIVQLREVARDWQKILRLQDWRVEIRYAKMGELPDGDLGNCHTQTTNKEAHILIRPLSLYANPKDADPIEQILIHELLHLHTSPLALPEDKRVQQENLVECLAWSFFRQKYPLWRDPLTDA